MFFAGQSRHRNSRHWIHLNQDGLTFRPFQLVFVLAFFLVFQGARCLASTAGTSKGEGITNLADSAIDARDIAEPDAARFASPSNDSGLEGKEDVPTLTFDHSALPTNDLLSVSVNSDKNTIRPAQSPECTLIRKSLCRLAKNRPLFALAAAQTAALVSDGVTTRQFLRRGYVEVDPIARILVGRKPTWGRMAPLGAVQVFAGAWLGERMATSRHPWMRRLWWLPQIAGIAANAAASAHNVTLR
jgi:hypothetical protein